MFEKCYKGVDKWRKISKREVEGDLSNYYRHSTEITEILKNNPGKIIYTEWAMFRYTPNKGNQAGEKNE